MTSMCLAAALVDLALTVCKDSWLESLKLVSAAGKVNLAE